MHVASLHMCSIITRCQKEMTKRLFEKVHEKWIFRPFAIKQNPFWLSRNHIHWKKSQNFTNAYGQAGGNPPSPLIMVSLTVNFPFSFFYPLPLDVSVSAWIPLGLIELSRTILLKMYNVHRIHNKGLSYYTLCPPPPLKIWQNSPGPVKAPRYKTNRYPPESLADKYQ